MNCQLVLEYFGAKTHIKSKRKRTVRTFGDHFLQIQGYLRIKHSSLLAQFFPLVLLRLRLLKGAAHTSAYLQICSYRQGNPGHQHKSVTLPIILLNTYTTGTGRPEESWLECLDILLNRLYIRMYVCMLSMLGRAAASNQTK